MAKCSKIRKKQQQYCAGDLRDLITIQDRDISAPDTFNDVDYDEIFTAPAELTDIPSAINTKEGRTYFDGVNTETPITHVIGLRFIAGITAENWVLFSGRRLDILKVKNLDERNEWLELTCNDRGLVTQEATKA